MTKDEVLKMAIEAMQSAYSSHGKILPSYPAQDAWMFHGCDEKLSKALQACKEALEQQEVGDAEIKQMLDDIEWYQKRVEELEQPAQEPVAWIRDWSDGSRDVVPANYDNSYPVYTHPSPSWQGLSDNEIQEELKKMWDKGLIPSYSIVAFARAIEQALKEKNNV